LLEDPSDAESFRIVDANRAAAEITTAEFTLIWCANVWRFSQALGNAHPGQLLATLRGGVACNLGENFLW